MNFETLAKTLETRKEPNYRLAQAKRAFYVELCERWEDLSVFPKALREALAAVVPWNALTVVKVQDSSDGHTIKTLFSCADGYKIETVLMRHEDERNTVCVSSQVGCAMACSFCATGTMGIKRNLTRDEIVGQVLHYARLLGKRGEHVTNVVLMGMGEPFHNYDEVMAALRILNDHEGFNLGARHMSISTCGIVPGILRLADEPMQVNLAISLHSAIDEKRSRLMPVNKAYPLAKLKDAVRIYMEKTNRRVMFEYLLLQGINDGTQDAEALARWLGPDYRLVHVNLIKYHETEAFKGSERPARFEFLEMLHRLHVPATHRITFGEDIDAACGQLAVRESGGKIMQGKTAVHEARTKA